MADSSLSARFSAVARRALPGADLVAHESLEGGVSARVHSLDVSAPDGRGCIVVRQHQATEWKGLGDNARVAEMEYGLLVALHGAGLAVPRPIMVDVSREVFPLPYLVMEKVAGTTEISGSGLDEALPQLANFLAGLHGCDVKELRLPDLPPREDPISGILESVPAGVDSRGLRNLLSSYSCATARSCLLHGDYWPGNVLWVKGHLNAVIDWEDAAIGAAVSDVACCRAELNVLFGRPAAERFTDCYRHSSKDDLRDVALWDLYVGSAALATLHNWGLSASAEAQRRACTLEFEVDAAKALMAGQS